MITGRLKDNLWSLRGKNPKEFWRKVKLKHKRFRYFSKLTSHETALDTSSENDMNIDQIQTDCLINTLTDQDEILYDILDSVITVSEIKKVINNLNNRKAAGIDKIIPELVKALDDNTLEIIALLNCILDSGVFPEEWSLGVAVILHKEGERSDLNNFRGITLLSVLGKLVVGILNNRLTSFVQKNEILLENQCGFRKGYQTTDHIFTLSTLIDHYVNKNQKKLFLCFVDFRKAFDKVDHCLLRTKLLNYGIDGIYEINKIHV